LANVVSQPSGLNMHPSSYQMIQNQGMAQIGITNRPSVLQNLFEHQITSAYMSNEPDPLLELANFTLIAPDNGNENYQVALTIPLSHQQLQYKGVGLPVTLDYSGSLQLAGSFSAVPEPSALLLSGICGIGMLLRRHRIATS
jgi:hypothetical protein